MTFKQYINPELDHDLDETFKEIGKLDPEQLKKGQRLEGGKNFKEVDSFYQIISRIKKNDLASDTPKGLDSLTVYSKADYRKMRCFIGHNNSSGYCIKGTELVSVFSSQGSSGSAIVRSAIRNGARHLDCYATYENGKLSGDLYSLYRRNGFKLDKKTDGVLGEPYTVQDGISRFVNSKGEVELDNPNVVIYMKV